MSTKYSQSFYFVKYVLSPMDSDIWFSVRVEEFLKLVGDSRPVFNPVGRLQVYFRDFTLTYVFCLSFNRLSRKRGYADYFSAEDLERVKNSEDQLVLPFVE